jgi:hypothetical protein
MSIELETTTEPTTDATATATAEATTADATGTAEPATAETPAPAEPPTPTPAEEIESEYRQLLASVSKWNKDDSALKAAFEESFEQADFEAHRAHSRPGLIPTWNALIENRRKYLAEIVPGIQAKMRAERIPRHVPAQKHSEARDALRKQLIELLVPLGWKEHYIQHCWDTILMKTNEPLEALRAAAWHWENIGYYGSVESEKWEATKIEREIAELENRLAEAKATALGQASPPPAPPAKPPTVYPGDEAYHESRQTIFVQRNSNGAPLNPVGPRTPAEIAR